jgi:hypothetical protein
MSTRQTAAGRTAMPQGPWVVVVGMHRSGTSAVTGALGSLGLDPPIAHDRWDPSDDNPDHWESRALNHLDDVLLEQLGGTWDRPPERETGWESDAGLGLDQLGDPATAASTAFPHPGPVVWKDPRSCLLLPYWLANIPKPVAAVFIWRSPLAVARSLQARDGLHLADGVALWERYNRSGLTGLAGVDTFVTQYESVVADPPGKLGDLVRWLEGLPQFAEHAPGWDASAAVASISPRLLRQEASDDYSILVNEQSSLVEELKTLEGPHHPLVPPALGRESPWTTAVLGDRQQLSMLSLQRDALRQTVADQRVLQTINAGKAQYVAGQLEVARSEIETLRSQLVGLRKAYEQMQASSSWRITRPLRQIVARRSAET